LITEGHDEKDFLSRAANQGCYCGERP